jgi:hypothetical protein
MPHPFLFRYLLLGALVLGGFDYQNVEARGPLANWFRGRWNASPSPPVAASRPATTPDSYPMPRSFGEPTIFGMGVGVGSYPPYNYPYPGQFNPYRFDSYLYDPYQSGSFEPPDLLNDPYFRERHRYDSHFPGRRYRN